MLSGATQAPLGLCRLEGDIVCQAVKYVLHKTGAFISCPTVLQTYSPWKWALFWKISSIEKNEQKIGFLIMFQGIKDGNGKFLITRYYDNSHFIYELFVTKCNQTHCIIMLWVNSQEWRSATMTTKQGGKASFPSTRYQSPNALEVFHSQENGRAKALACLSSLSNPCTCWSYSVKLHFCYS